MSALHLTVLFSVAVPMGLGLLLDRIFGEPSHHHPLVGFGRYAAAVERLIRRVAEMARRMHGGGVNHRDFYICHFLLHLDPVPSPANFKLSLIDLHRAQLRDKTPRRWRDKDLASLYFSALDIGLTQRDLLRFLRQYFDRPLRLILREEKTLLRHLAGEARRLQARYLRKYAEGESV